jgi:replicative DNA helicase
MERNGDTKTNGERRPRRSAGLITPSAPDRVPPHSMEAEQAFLGCCLLDPAATVNLTRSRIKKPDELLYDLRHAAILDVMVGLVDAGKHCDLITTQQALADRNQLEAVGGTSYLMALPDAAPSAAAAEYYLAILEEKLQLRRLISVCTHAVSEAYESDGRTVDSVIGAAESAVLGVRLRDGAKAPSQRELVGQAIEEIERLHQLQGAIGGISTGLVDLDYVHDGLHDDEFVVLAAYPSTGKTALALNIATAVASAGHAVGIVSQEMKARKLVLRQMAGQARVNLQNIRKGHLAERDFPKLTHAATKLASLPMHWCDIPGMSVYQVRAQARQWYAEHGIKLLVVDYLQLLSAEGGPRRLENRQLEVADISRVLKNTAAELDLAVLGLSQLNDDGQLRESRAIGQDADSVWILRRAAAADEQELDAIPIDLDIRKQRNGPMPYTVNLTFFKGYTLFENAAKTGDIPA